MKAYLFVAFLCLMSGRTHASVDGEVAWTKLSFCNGAEYCIDIASSRGVGIESLHITHKRKAIDVPSSLVKDVDVPLLNETRLLSIQRSGGVFENCLEIPFLTIDEDKTHRSVLRIFILNDEVSGSELKVDQPKT